MKQNIYKLQIISILKGTAFYLPIVSLFFLSQGVALTLIVISQVFYGVFFLIGNIPAGVLADRIGQKQSLILGSTASALGYLLMIIIPGSLGLLVAYSFRGIGKSFTSGSDESLMYESVIESQNSAESFRKHWGSYGANEVIGFALSTLFAGVMLSKLGSQSYIPLIVLTGLFELFAIIVASSLKNPKKYIENAKRKTTVMMKASFGLIKSNRTVSTLLIVPILTFSGEYFLYSVYQPYFKQYSVPALFIGLVLTIGGVLNYIVLKNIYRLEKYLTLDKLVPIFSIILALGYALLAYFTTPIILVASFIILKGLFNGQNPIIADYIHENTASNIRTTVTSSISFIQQLFQILARIILGFLVSIIGVAGAFKAQAIYLLIGSVLAYFVMRACGCTQKIKKHYPLD